MSKWETPDFIKSWHPVCICGQRGSSWGEPWTSKFTATSFYCGTETKYLKRATCLELINWKITLKNVSWVLNFIGLNYLLMRACINSSIKSSYCFPVTLGFLLPIYNGSSWSFWKIHKRNLSIENTACVVHQVLCLWSTMATLMTLALQVWKFEGSFISAIPILSINIWQPIKANINYSSTQTMLTNRLTNGSLLCLLWTHWHLLKIIEINLSKMLKSEILKKKTKSEDLGTNTNFCSAWCISSKINENGHIFRTGQIFFYFDWDGRITCIKLVFHFMLL